MLELHIHTSWYAMTAHLGFRLSEWSPVHALRMYVCVCVYCKYTAKSKQEVAYLANRFCSYENIIIIIRNPTYVTWRCRCRHRWRWRRAVNERIRQYILYLDFRHSNLWTFLLYSSPENTFSMLTRRSHTWFMCTYFSCFCCSLQRSSFFLS